MDEQSGLRVDASGWRRDLSDAMRCGVSAPPPLSLSLHARIERGEWIRIDMAHRRMSSTTVTLTQSEQAEQRRLTEPVGRLHPSKFFRVDHSHMAGLDGRPVELRTPRLPLLFSFHSAAAFIHPQRWSVGYLQSSPLHLANLSSVFRAMTMRARRLAD